MKQEAMEQADLLYSVTDGLFISGEISQLTEIPQPVNELSRK